MSRKTLSRALAGVAAAAALIVATPLAASAHVTIDPNTADPGEYTSIHFRVPNESTTASTVRVEVQLPTDDPFLSVLYQPIPGWTITVTDEKLPKPVEVEGSRITEAPTKVVFEAGPGAAIAPGQFQDLTLSLGPVPDTGQIMLPAIQTYDDGTVAKWTATTKQVAADDTLDPAPVLYVGDAPVADDDHPAPARAQSDGSGSGLAVGLSIASLVVAAGAAVLAAMAFVGRRRKTS